MKNIDSVLDLDEKLIYKIDWSQKQKFAPLVMLMATILMLFAVIPFFTDFVNKFSIIISHPPKILISLVIFGIQFFCINNLLNYLYTTIWVTNKKLVLRTKWKIHLLEWDKIENIKELQPRLTSFGGGLMNIAEIKLKNGKYFLIEYVDYKKINNNLS